MVHVAKVEDRLYYEVEDETLDEDEGNLFLVETSTLTGTKVFRANGDDNGEEVEDGELKAKIILAVQEDILRKANI